MFKQLFNLDVHGQRANTIGLIKVDSRRDEPMRTLNEELTSRNFWNLPEYFAIFRLFFRAFATKRAGSFNCILLWVPSKVLIQNIYPKLDQRNLVLLNPLLLNPVDFELQKESL